MDQVPELAMRWWRRLDDTQRRCATAVVLCCAVYIFHYVVYCIPQPFFIEDAAISYSYAKHLVEGEGLVSYPGGERVEGYSNALWTFLGAAFYALGMPLWTSAKLMGAVFGVLTLPIVYALTRRMRPGGTVDVALLAPLVLALHPSFVVWNASGLENSLFCLLLAGSSLRLIQESEDHTLRPWSAFGFFLLTMTRPEGIMYAFLALVAQLLYAVADRRPLRVLTWSVAFALPFVAYNGWRYWYFAWELPNTYYAKLGVDRFHPYSWNAKGWKYIKKYLVQYGVVFGLPLLFFALGSGRTLWKRRLSVSLIAILSVLIFWDGNLTRPPEWWPESYSWPDMPSAIHRLRAEWIEIRVWSIAGAAGLMGLVTLTWDGWRTRGLLWCHCTAAVFFALYSGGDWMKEWRWFNIVSVTLIPLLLAGLGEVLDALVDDDWEVSIPRAVQARWEDLSAYLRARETRQGTGADAAWTVRARSVFLLAAVLPFIGREVQRGVGFAFSPETAVRDIQRRVYYMSDVQRQLDIDHVTLLDVDMGAHLYFSGWDIVDIAGLIDVPMARHSDFNRKFILEYIFEERLPDFAHVHSGWARQSKIDKQRPWKLNYLEIPGYPLVGRQLHVGNHIRRDLFIEPFQALPEEQVANFTEQVQLLSHEIPSPEVAPGSALHFRTWWHAEGREANFLTLFWLDDGQGNRIVRTIEPGYGWYAPTEWKIDEKVAGRFWIPIPDDMPLGTYQAGVVVIDEEGGEVLAYRGEQAGETVYLDGEMRLEQRVSIVSAADALALADAEQQAALQQAAAGECERAWTHFKDATRHVDGDEDWRASRERDARQAVALCHLARAEQVSERDEKIPHLKEARRWDHRAPGLAAAIRPVALNLRVQGDAFAGQGDWEGAYRVWSTSLALEPFHSWTRRRAEDARDKRLGITRPGAEPDPEPAASSPESSGPPRPRIRTPEPREIRTPGRLLPLGADADKEAGED